MKMKRAEIKAIEKKAAELREQHGGTIFVFPIKEDDPFSKYVFTFYLGKKFTTYPQYMSINEAASNILETLNTLKENGYDSDYERNVRMITYEAQVNAPDVTMRRLKNSGHFIKKNDKPTGYLQEGIDVFSTDDGYNFSAKGLIKFTYLSMVDDDLPKAHQFMDKYYKLLAMRRYGKTSVAIKHEVRKMNKDQAIQWIEKTYKQYIHDDMEVSNILNSL